MNAPLRSWALFPFVFRLSMLRTTFCRSVNGRAESLPAVRAKFYLFSIHRLRFLRSHFTILAQNSLARQEEGLIAHATNYLQ